MALPENPSGRDLAAFADELRQATRVVDHLRPSPCGLADRLAQAAGLANDHADRLFAREARQALQALFDREASGQAVHTAAYEEDGRAAETVAFKDGWHVSAELGLTIHYDAKRKLVHVSR